MNWKFWERKNKNSPSTLAKAQPTQAAQKTAPDKTSKNCASFSPPLTTNFTAKENQSGKKPIRISACERCGACCAFFPVNFPEMEIDDPENGNALTTMSLPARHLMRVMRGTELNPPRCIALEGEVSIRVFCTIYAARPSTCRNFIRSWEENSGNSLCDRARAAYGMQPFSKY